jgi:SAM-dependent methyltransferase
MNFPTRPCPVCSGQRNRLLYRQQFGSLSKGSLLEGYNLVVCDDCGCAFADQIPEQATFDRHYTEMSKYEYRHLGTAESEFDAARFEVIADHLAALIPDKESRILDVGCATGGLLARLRQRGFRNVSGLDPSPGCAELARTHYDIEVQTGTVFQNNLPSETYDVIIVVGVLEHIREVKTAVGNLRGCLRKNGFVFAEVPDATAYQNWPDAPFQEFSVEHINFFSPGSLTNLFEQSGFELKRMDRPPRQFTKTTVMPSAAGFYQLSSAPPSALRYDTESELCLKLYIEQSQNEENRIAELIQELVISRQPIIVWGVGTHTLHLIKTTNLDQANIVAFTDSGSKYHGTSLHGRPVVAPEELESLNHPILVSSRAFQEDIIHTLQNECHLAHTVIRLYPDCSSTFNAI